MKMSISRTFIAFYLEVIVVHPSVFESSDHSFVETGEGNFVMHALVSRTRVARHLVHIGVFCEQQEAGLRSKFVRGFL